MRGFFFLFFIFFLIFFRATNAHAVTVTINNYSSTVSSEIISVEASISGATNATNYLRVDLYKEGTNNYFGETYNGSDWYAGSDGKSYFPVQIQNSSASAIIQAQIGNPSTNSYPGPGIYKLKLRRYTSSGSQSQNDQQIPVDIQLTYVFPTPTSTDTPTSVPTATPTPTSTPTPAPTNTPTITATVTPTKKITSSPSPTLDLAGLDVLGSSDSASPSSDFQIPTPPVSGQVESREIGPLAFGGIAATTLSLLSLAFWRLRRLTRLDGIK